MSTSTHTTPPGAARFIRPPTNIGEPRPSYSRSVTPQGALAKPGRRAGPPRQARARARRPLRFDDVGCHFLAGQGMARNQAHKQHSELLGGVLVRGRRVCRARGRLGRRLVCPAGILIGITCSGTKARRGTPSTAPRCAATVRVGCRTRVGRPASPSWYRRTSPSRYRWICSASLPVCPPRRRGFRGMALKSGLSSIKRMCRAMWPC